MARFYVFIYLLAIISIWISTCTGTEIILKPSTLEKKKTGDNFAVMCQVQNSDVAPTWWKVSNGKEIQILMNGSVQSRPSGLSAMLSFNGAKLEDAGVYKCVSGESVKDITVTLYKRITFVDSPKEQHPIAGTDAVIQCRPDADPAPLISWTKDGRGIGENGGRYMISENGDLTVPNFEPEHDNGVYLCEAFQGESGDTQQLEITVTGYVAPTTPTIALLNKEKWPKGIHEDATNVKITCSAGGFPTPVYAWRKDDESLVDDGHFKLSQAGILEIAKVAKDDGGVYECEASNAVAKTKASLAVNVFEKPRIEKITSPTVMADSTTKLECKFTGTEPMHANWMNLGNVIAVRDESDYDADVSTSLSPESSEKYVILENGKATLHLRGIQLSDAGEYQCAVSNDAGTANENVNLRVFRSPLIVSKTMGTVRGVLTAERALNCEASALPEPAWTWSKDGRQLSNVDGRLEIATNASREKHRSSTTLKVILSSESDFGKYTCTAKNEYEPAGQETIEIIKIEPPHYPDLSCDENAKPTIITLRIAAFSDREAETHWPTDVEILVSRQDDSSFVTLVDVKFDPKGHYKIPKLDPTTAYVFNVTGRNEAGFSPSSTVVCSTAEPAPPGKPVFVDEGPIRCNTTRECKISWFLDDTGGKPISKYDVQLYLVNENGETQEILSTYTNEQNYVLANLKARTKYEIRVRAENEEGVSEPAAAHLISPEESATIPNDVFVGKRGPGAGTIVAVVIIIVLLIVVLVDVACYYVNHCGVLMCICVNVCGKPSPQAKCKDALMEMGGVKEARIDEQTKCEQIVITAERADVDVTSESTPMIAGGQNGHGQKHPVSTVV